MSDETPTLEERVEALEAAAEKQKTHTHTVRAFIGSMQIRHTSEPVVEEDGD
jgi:hypothetical protein